MPTISHRERLQRDVDKRGCRLVVEQGRVLVRGVECIVSGGRTAKCDIAVCVDASGNLLGAAAGAPPHTAEVTLYEDGDGLVYDNEGKRIESTIFTDSRRICRLSIKLGSQAQPRDYDDQFHCLRHYMKKILGYVDAARKGIGDFVQQPNPFTFSSAFESRAGLQGMQNRICGHSTAILGLGGTGSYILDMMVKTPVFSIHIFDGDRMQEWNTFRAPGSPDEHQLSAITKEDKFKVDYYAEKYGVFRTGIEAYPRNAGAQDVEFLAEKGVDFAFVAIDPSSNGKRQDEIYDALERVSIPFIDAGMCVTLNDDKLDASLQVVVGSNQTRYGWRDVIPNSQLSGLPKGDYRNSQIAELNALNAALAVIEWRKATGQFSSHKTLEVLKFKTADATTIGDTGESRRVQD